MGPITSAGQQAVLAQSLINQPAASQPKPVENLQAKERQIQPQGAQASGSEQSATNNNNTFQAQEQAQSLIASGEPVGRGSVVNIVI
jgi:hypothetical protein